MQLQITLVEAIGMSVSIPQTDGLTIEDDGIGFAITKGPQDTIDIHDWIRVERKPVNISWKN